MEDLMEENTKDTLHFRGWEKEERYRLEYISIK